MKVAELAEKLQAFAGEWEVGFFDRQSLKWIPLKGVELKAMRSFGDNLLPDPMPGDHSVLVAELKK